MFEHIRLLSPDDFFIELNNRNSRGIYFYRINGYNDRILEFIKKYYKAASSSGVVIEGKIPNPDERNLAYYSEMMGMDFVLSMDFISSALKKWLPRMNDYQVNSVAGAVYDTLDILRKNGKNENMQKNAYIKFMCWLYYKFERIVSQLGSNNVPKILYQGDISNYELLLIRILAQAGCDVVLLQYSGDDSYKKLDAGSQFSDELVIPGMTAFPDSFNLKWLREELQKDFNAERLYGGRTDITNCTNAWIEGRGLNDIRTPISHRGSDSKTFYNCFLRINGVEDKLTYLNELYQLQLELKNSGRRLVIEDEQIEQPSVDEISLIKRGVYADCDSMISGLSVNIKNMSDGELQKLMIKAFADVMSEEAKKPGMTLNRLTNRAVILLCFIKRYNERLFGGLKLPQISCFIHMGACVNDSESVFLRYLAKLPCDVLILKPNINDSCCLEDKMLYEINFQDTLTVKKFPQESTQINIGTAAYHAERELDSIMYTDSGMYRNQQYTRANAVTLKTIYEEIAILWEQELKYRPNFSVVDDVVNMPVIFAKVSGVKDSDLSGYWSDIKGLFAKDTYLVRNVPLISPTDANPIKPYATEFFKNGRLQRDKIKGHQAYRYGMLREETQEHILNKLQLLIDRRTIKGTFENGTEYTIVSTVLNMNTDIVRMIQRFDFTRRNPKMVYINTTEKAVSLEDAILTAFLNLIGFDVVFFVPTGYRTIEKYFSSDLAEEHQIGEYIYDLRVPNFNNVQSGRRQSWRERIFGR